MALKCLIQLKPLPEQPVVSVSLCMSVTQYIIVVPLSFAEEDFGTPSPKRHKTSSGECV